MTSSTRSISITSRCLSLLEKCKNLKQLKQAHANVITCGLSTNTFALSRLLAFCSNHPHQHETLTHASTIFHHIQSPTICIFNTMIKTYFLNKQLNNTVNVFSKIFHFALLPDHYTFPYVLKACAELGDCCYGKLVHGCASKLGLVGDIYVGNALSIMYARVCDMGSAGKMFDEMPKRCAVSWTVMISGYARVGDVDTAREFFDAVEVVKDRGIWGAMISGYVQNGCFKEGLCLFRLMQMDGVEPDEAVFVSVLCACANMGALDVGIWVHRYLEKLGVLLSVRVKTALIDMYAKCGNLEVAKRVFDGMYQRDIVCWNAMISGMAMHGNGRSALELFSEMEDAGVRPDDITFIAVITACSHSGMAHEGLQIVEKMLTLYKIEPKGEHYGCIIDLLSRAGLLNEASEIIGRMPNISNPSEEAVVWRALLSACCGHGQTKLAEFVTERLVLLERHSGAYVLLSNLYAATGKHAEARSTRNMMKNRGIDKTPGCSSIEIDGIVSEFIAGEKTQNRMEDIYLLLESMNHMGYSG